MARSESTNYRVARRSFRTAPRLFIRPYFVRTAGAAVDYAFSRDFASHDVLSPSVVKINCIARIQGNTQRIDPVAMRSDIGILTTFVVDRDSEITRYMADPARPLSTSIAGAGTPSYIEVDDASGYPQAGHVTIDAEDFKYTSKDLTTTPHRLGGTITRPARDTSIAAHAAAALVRNGEQLRRGGRVTLFAGYEELTEADYGPGPGYVKMQITTVEYDSRTLTWQIEAADIQRTLKASVFGNASPTALAILGPEHPLTLLLKVWCSTGDGTNGPYDVYAADIGAAIPQGLVDVAAIELVRDSQIPGLLMQFRELEPQEVKAWSESQILRPLNLVIFITQEGKLSVRRFGTPVFRGSAIAIDDLVVAA